MSSRVVIYGLVAGALVGLLGSALRALLDLVMDGVSYVLRFRPPGPTGEGGLMMAFGETFPWGLLAIPVLAALAVLLRGRDADDPLEEAVRHYHGERDGWPPLASQFRAVAGSVLAYASSAAVGRDGPFAALGNLGARVLVRLARLSLAEGRTLALACTAAALGLVLHAPIAAAVLAVEMLYRRFEFEVEVLLPSLLASVAAYAVYGAVHGFGPLVSANVLEPPVLTQVPLYGLLALAVGAVAWLVAFLRSELPAVETVPVPRAVLAAVFGLIVAAVAYFMPEVLGDGTGWWELSLTHVQDTESAVQGLVRAALVLGVAWLGLGGTVLSSVSAGGLLGVGLAALVPGLSLDASVAGLVGAAAFLTTTHNVPVAATLLLAAWGGDALLPALLAGTLLSHAVSGEASILRTQARSRATSGAHALPVPPVAPEQAVDPPPAQEAAAAEAGVEEQLYRLPVPTAWLGLPAEHVVWPAEVQYVAVVRDGEVTLTGPGDAFREGDELVLLAEPAHFEGFSSTLASLRGAASTTDT